MEHDTIRIHYDIFTTKDDPPKRCLIPSLWINDERVSEEAIVDMQQLVASLKGSGQYEILTCTCGEPGCAGIWEGIVVIHSPKTIRWLIHRHIQDQEELPEREIDDDILMFRDRYFRRDDYLKAIYTAIETARDIVSKEAGEIGTVPHGLSIEDLLQLQAM